MSEPQRLLARAETLCEERGVRLTEQRRGVLELIGVCASCSHPGTEIDRQPEGPSEG